MDSNGQRFWMLADAAHYQLAASDLYWDNGQRALRLRSRRSLPSLPRDRNAARLLSRGMSSTVDPLGDWARVVAGGRSIVAGGAADSETPLYEAAVGESVLDLCLGNDGVLYVVVGQRGVASRIVMLDRRERFEPMALAAPDFCPDCLVAAQDGGAWVLDRQRGRLARVRGMPWRTRPAFEFAEDATRPCRENPNPARLELRDDVHIPAGSEIVGMATAPDGRVAFLLWPADSDAQIMLFNGQLLDSPTQLDGAHAPYALGWLGNERWGLWFDNVNEVIAYVPNGPLAEPIGDRYPLVESIARLPCNTTSDPAQYLSGTGSNLRPRPLHRLSLPSLPTWGEAQAARPFDSGSHGTLWHRLYLEASFPAGTGARIWLAAADDPSELGSAEEFEHVFGSLRPSQSDAPKGVWSSSRSELPFHPGLLRCQCEAQRSGLFTVLVQRANKTVRTLQGRYLRARVELVGTGLSSPELAAVRVYAPRFSYLDRYLPELYRETLFGPEANRTGPASAPDFLQRFLGLFESVLTPLEDRVAAAHLLARSDSAPPELLDGLAGWFGMTFDAALPEQRRRRMLSEATRLFRRRGTLDGFEAMLDVVSGGAVARGQIVVLEDYRLRRLFATILGADLSDENDPLLLGRVTSGNAYIGDTLFLGNDERAELAALFLPENDNALTGHQVRDFYDQLAYRVTVLIERDLPASESALIQRTAEREAPAHVEVRIIAASARLIVGLAALMGIDTHVSAPWQPRAAQVGSAVLTRSDFVLGSGGLDPRREGGSWEVPDTRLPVASLVAGDAEYGASFELDGRGSFAYGGRVISDYVWEWVS